MNRTTHHRKKHSNVWHGINLHHPLRSMQSVHPIALFLTLLGLYFCTVLVIIGIARLVGS